MTNPPSATRPLTAANAAAISSSFIEPDTLEIEADHQEQHGQRRRELEQDRHATDQRRSRQEQLVAQAHDHAHMRKQRADVRAGDTGNI